MEGGFEARNQGKSQAEAGEILHRYRSTIPIEEIYPFLDDRPADKSARAAALTDGRDYVVPDDVKRLAVPALAHRVIPRALDTGALDAESVVRAIVQDVPVPR